MKTREEQGEPRSAVLPAARDKPDATDPDTLLVLSETLDVAKRRVRRGRVRVSTRTERHQEVAAIELFHNSVSVIRVPVGQIVEAAPQVRVEDGVTIVPVVEERFVVVKQLFLKEELHIRNDTRTVTEQVPVELRRQVAVVERIDAEGRVLDVTFDTEQRNSS